jgi:hypothetical protein
VTQSGTFLKIFGFIFAAAGVIVIFQSLAAMVRRVLRRVLFMGGL